MRVKIIKATLPSFWYAGQIGSEFNVEEHTHDKYKLIKDVTLSSTISKSDCEILPEETPQPEPFDLERALKGEKVFTRDGRKVIILSDKSIHPTQPVIGDIDFEPGDFGLRWSKDGLYCLDGVSETGLDLFMAPKQPQVVTLYINVYPSSDGNGYITGVPFENEADAIRLGKDDKDYLKTIPITFTI